MQKSSTGCWEWTAGKRHGYGAFYLAGRMVQAHQVAYELLVGPAPDGLFLVLDHTCENKGCVNPSHLVISTKRQNRMRGLPEYVSPL